MNWVLRGHQKRWYGDSLRLLGRITHGCLQELLPQAQPTLLTAKREPSKLFSTCGGPWDPGVVLFVVLTLTSSVSQSRDARVSAGSAPFSV